MTGSISNLAGSVSGAHNVSRLAQTEKSKESARKERAKPPASQTHDVVELESADAVRSLKDQTQEEAQEDRQENPAYGADRKPSGPTRARFDVQG
ncbi:MAG: hypothetical protein Kow0022_12010 [Phycisphaerales bacterium]